MNIKKDKFRGCLVGGAVGDALGYPVEFMSVSQMRNKYGEPGITRYELKNDVAQISDDTQMTLFTANGILFGITRGAMRGIMGSIESYVWTAYRDWYNTQVLSDMQELWRNENGKPFSWLCRIVELYNRRTPGVTCISAIQGDHMGCVNKQINNSKGCGGVMRVAPMGLVCVRYPQPEEEILMYGAKIAALTHSHPLGYIPAATLSYLIWSIAKDENNTPRLETLIWQSIEATRRSFAQYQETDYLCKLLDKAISLAHNSTNDEQAIASLGEGWVAEEALAVAVYCAVKYSDNFEKAIIAAVNHSGDSDSTGAICGNILGAYLGMSAIPEYYLEKLEIKDIITEVADDLYTGCIVSEYAPNDTIEEVRWIRKYVYIEYPTIEEC